MNAFEKEKIKKIAQVIKNTVGIISDRIGRSYYHLPLTTTRDGRTVSTIEINSKKSAEYTLFLCEDKSGDLQDGQKSCYIVKEDEDFQIDSWKRVVAEITCDNPNLLEDLGKQLEE